MQKYCWFLKQVRVWTLPKRYFCSWAFLPLQHTLKVFSAAGVTHLSHWSCPFPPKTLHCSSCCVPRFMHSKPEKLKGVISGNSLSCLLQEKNPFQGSSTYMDTQGTEPACWLCHTGPGLLPIKGSAPGANWNPPGIFWRGTELYAAAPTGMSTLHVPWPPGSTSPKCLSLPELSLKEAAEILTWCGWHLPGVWVSEF